ncbi:MAG: MCE family protein [Candidatus Firestonebacteria bacterium]|nr:MCE family protein [Candidatus Firestonebacteria bacterium]
MKQELKVGLMSLIAMVLLLSMTFSVGKLNPFKHLGPEIPIAFNYVGNLKLNANARISGVIIGKVLKIDLDNDKVIVIVQLDTSDTKIKKNSQIFISSEGLIGESYIDIKTVPADSPFYQEGDPPLIGTDPVGVGEIMSDTKSLTLKLQQTLDIVVSEKSKANMDVIMTNMAETSQGLNALIKQNQALINSIFENLNKMISVNQKNIQLTSQNFSSFSNDLKDMSSGSKEKINNILTNIHSLTSSLDKKTVDLADELLALTKSINKFSDENQKKLSIVLSNMESITNKLNQMTNTFVAISEKIEKGPGTLGKLVNDSTLYYNLNKTVEEARSITPELKMTLSSLRDLTDKANRGEGTIGQLVTDKNLYQNINELVIDSRKVITKISDIRTFWGYELDYRFPNTKNSIKKDFKNAFIFKFEPRPGKYYKVELNNAGETDNSKVSVEVGQLFFDKLILRAGVIESTGGVGANYLLLNNKLSSGFTAFNFNQEGKPALRFSNELGIYENTYFTFGVDNMLNKERYYAGMRYLIEDKDVKYLMGLVSFK